MLKWYALVLIGAAIGGWLLYPFAYPAVTKVVASGELPKIDWSRLKPASLAMLKEGPVSSVEEYPDSTISAPPKAVLPKRIPIASGDRRFDPVVMIEGSGHRATGCIIKRGESFYILTSQHALEGNPRLKVTDSAGREFRGRKIIAAQNADVAMIEIESPPADLAHMQVAQNVEAIAKLQDKLLIAGDSSSDGVLEMERGKLRAIDSSVLDIEAKIYPGLRGAPIFHPESRAMIGIVAEVGEGTMEEMRKTLKADVSGVIGDAVLSPELTVSVYYIGQRIDTIDRWELLDWSDFQSAAATIKEARIQLDQILRFLSGDSGYWGIPELQKAEREVRQLLIDPTRSQSDRLNAVEDIIQVAQSMTSRLSQDLKKAKYYHIHKRDFVELMRIVKEIGSVAKEANDDLEGFGRQFGL